MFWGFIRRNVFDANQSESTDGQKIRSELEDKVKSSVLSLRYPACLDGFWTFWIYSLDLFLLFVVLRSVLFRFIDLEFSLDFIKCQFFLKAMRNQITEIPEEVGEQ